MALSLPILKHNITCVSSSFPTLLREAWLTIVGMKVRLTFAESLASCGSLRETLKQNRAAGGERAPSKSAESLSANRQLFLLVNHIHSVIMFPCWSWGFRRFGVHESSSIANTCSKKDFRVTEHESVSRTPDNRLVWGCILSDLVLATSLAFTAVSVGTNHMSLLVEQHRSR